jgi:uncharacterized protein (UPF0332 family)
MKNAVLDGQDRKKALTTYWFQKAHESLESARSEYASGRLSFAVNRIYYACFYALSALLRHKGLRSALHRDLVKAGIVKEADYFEKRRNPRFSQTKQARP